ncbi:30S ribosomal protein S9 [Candidatus Woesearchaeota archaeon]|nr:30S ribosomal protein S9 [Candidatus Woesearchaeota archaeon]
MKINNIITEGKRKKAIARAVLSPGKGFVTINGRALHYYGDPLLQLRIAEPLTLAGDAAKNVNIDISLFGGGVSGQADAARLAVARALVKHNQKLEAVFDEYDRFLLVADVRQNESCKPNDSKPRAKRQKSYR